jgi:hypothetical protein
MVATPHLRHTSNSDLYDVACVSSTSCMAVGARYSDVQGHSVTLAERWDGVDWQVVKTPRLPNHGEGDAVLTDVDCPKEGSCLAVGFALGFTSGPDLTEAWDGTAWTVEPIALPPGATGSLGSVDCVRADDCMAVGDFNLPGQPSRPLVEHWDGTDWSQLMAPRPPGKPRDAGLVGVSCSSGTDCMAVGGIWWTHLHVFVEHWDGVAWSVVPSPEPHNPRYPDNSFADISCASPGMCVAVGFSSGAPRGQEIERTLVERWDGATWSIEPVRLRSGNNASFAELQDVSCTSVTDCMAVGGLRSNVLAERWDGATWTKQIPPKPQDTDSAMYGVDCIRPSRCVAVGESSTQLVDATLAERYGP